MNNQEHKLRRELSLLNVWSLALGCIIGSGAFILPGSTFLPGGGPAGTAIAITIGAAVMIIIAFNYDFMIRHYPSAGGEFTYAKEVFGRRNAFVCSWFLLFSYIVIVPQNASALAFISRSLIGGVFQRGFHYKAAGYDVYAGEIVLSLCALVVFALLAVRGVKITGLIQTCLVFALLGGVAVLAVSAIISPKASFSNLSPAFSPDYSRAGGVLRILAVTPWAFVGFDTIPQSAEEFKFFHYRTKYVMCFSILFGAAVYILINTITASVLPAGYVSWADYVRDIPNKEGIISLPAFNVFDELLGKSGKSGIVFLGISVLGAVLSCIIGFYMAASRLIYSMARDEFLPAWFGGLHARHNTPSNAIFFIMGVSMLAPFFGRTVWGWIVDMSSVGAAVGYGYTSGAALKLAVREGNTPIVFSGAAGVVMSLIFLALLLIPVPALNCSLSKESYLCLSVWVILGAIFSKFSRNRE